MNIADFVHAVSHSLRPFGFGLRSRSTEATFARLRERLETATGCCLNAKRQVSLLSIGQQKRLMLAATLSAVHLPRVLAVDEPLAGVDANGILRMIDLLNRARREGVALLVAEHRNEINSLEFDDVLHMPYGASTSKACESSSPGTENEHSSGETQPILVLDHFEGGYPQMKVHCEHFELLPGGTAILAGENGAGKTGFLKGIFGLAPAVAQGTIRLAGRQIEGFGAEALRSQVRYMSQDRASFSDLRVSDALTAAVPESMTLDPMLRDALRAVGWKKRVMHLSSGNRAVLVLAQTLASRPIVALLDEPFANVDARNRSLLVEMIQHARQELGTAFMIVEHGELHLGDAANYTVCQEGNRAHIRREQ
jgi:ABC-type Mn2+/Zn2+ transport system ATPase subunit